MKYTSEQEKEYLIYLLGVLSSFYDTESGTMESLRDCIYGVKRHTITGNRGTTDTSYFLRHETTGGFVKMGISVYTISEYYRNKKINSILN